MARLSSELVLSLTDRVSGPAAGVGRSLNKLKRDQHGLAQSSRMTADSAREMGRAQSLMLAGASRVLAPIAGAVSASQVISTAADFETALTNIQKKAGATAVQTAKLGEEIKALATSGELAVPIEEIAAAYERGAAAGIPLDELRAFASLSAKAADAFEMSATDVANASAGFTNVLKVPRAEMERYFDLINGLADSGIADESGIVDYIDQAGAMAKTFGLSAQETAAFGAALANLKVSAAKGATATNAIFTRLMAPDALSGDAREAYYRLIKDDKKFKKQLASGKADEAFVGVLDSLRAMNKEARTGVIVELFGQDHLDVMTQMVEGADELKRNLAYAAGTDWFGSLDKSYKLKLDDFWSQWQLLKNDLATAAIDVGTAGMPVLKAGLQGARDLIGQIRDGMTQLEMQIDWSQVDAAKLAVGDLGEQLRTTLGMDTSGSTLGEFFRDLAKVIDGIAATTRYVSRELADVTEFARDPIGYMKKPMTDERLRAAGITPMTDERRAEIERERQQNRDREVIDRRGRMGSSNRIDAVQARIHAAANGELGAVTPPAERGGRIERAVRPFAPPMPAAVPAPVFDGPLGRSTGAVALPTPRPDIVGPVTREGEAAALKAKELAARIIEAFSVTATPQINSASLDTFISKVRTARSELDALNAQGARGGRVGRADYSGLHEDIEN